MKIRRLIDFNSAFATVLYNEKFNDFSELVDDVSGWITFFDKLKKSKLYASAWNLGTYAGGAGIMLTRANYKIPKELKETITESYIPSQVLPIDNFNIFDKNIFTVHNNIQQGSWDDYFTQLTYIKGEIENSKLISESDFDLLVNFEDNFSLNRDEIDSRLRASFLKGRQEITNLDSVINLYMSYIDSTDFARMSLRLQSFSRIFELDEELLEYFEEEYSNVIYYNDKMNEIVLDLETLVEEVETPAYISSINLEYEENIGANTSNVISAEFKNFGSTDANGVYFKLEMEDSFITTVDSVYVGNLGANQTVKVQFAYNAPNENVGRAFSIVPYSSGQDIPTSGYLNTSGATSVDNNQLNGSIDVI